MPLGWLWLFLDWVKGQSLEGGFLCHELASAHKLVVLLCDSDTVNVIFEENFEQCGWREEDDPPPTRCDVKSISASDGNNNQLNLIDTAT